MSSARAREGRVRFEASLSDNGTAAVTVDFFAIQSKKNYKHKSHAKAIEPE